MDRQQYLDAQHQVAVNLQKQHMGDVLTEVQFSRRSEEFYGALMVIANCDLDPSRIEACNDISAILHEVAMGMAKQHLDQAIEDNLNERAATEYELRKMEAAYA